MAGGRAAPHAKSVQRHLCAKVRLHFTVYVA